MTTVPLTLDVLHLLAFDNMEQAKYVAIVIAGRYDATIYGYQDATTSDFILSTAEPSPARERSGMVHQFTVTPLADDAPVERLAGIVIANDRADAIDIIGPAESY